MLDDLTLRPNGGSLSLRPPRLADAKALHPAINDPDVARMLARVPMPLPFEAAIGWVEMVRAAQVNGVAMVFTIVDDGPIGVIGFQPFGATADLGYWLARPHWGRGIMTVAAAAAIEAAFSAGARSIVSGAFDDNPASLRVQTKLGFETVGESRVYCLARKAKLRHIDTSLTRERYRARQ